MIVEARVGSRVRQDLRRERLVTMLDGVPGGAVATIVAGAGSRKSTLLTEWTRTRRDVASVTVVLDPRSADPTVFARALVAAIDQRFDGFADHLEDLFLAGSGQPGRAFAARLVVAIEALGHDLVLLIDDAHLIGAGGTSTLLDGFVNGLPENLRMIITSRWDPPLTLHRLRLDGRLVEVRASDLAFDRAETRSLIEAVSGVTLDDSEIAVLHRRTEGWTAGVQLAAISLRHSADATQFVDDFGGSDVLVAEYLSREVLDSLDDETRRFVMATSVLPWLSTDLCDAVIEDMVSSEVEVMLDHLERESLFVVPMTSDGRRCRYHHLFADLILYILRHDEPQSEDGLRRRAAAFLADHGDVAGAVEQYLELADVDEVLRLAVEHGRLMYERNESATLVRWLAAAESLCIEPLPELGIQLLAAQIAAMDTAAATETYWRVRRRDNLSIGQEATLHALYCLLGLDDLSAHEVEVAASAALRLLQNADDDDLVDVLGIGGRSTIELFGRFMPGLAAFYRGDLQAALDELEAVLELEAMQYPVWKMHALGVLGLVRGWCGDVTAARSLATAAVDLARHGRFDGHVGLAHARHALALAALDRLELAEAAEQLHLAGIAVEQSNRAALRATHRWLQGVRRMRVDGPMAALAELEAAPPPAIGPPLIVCAEVELRMRLRIASGNLLAAQDLFADGTPASETAGFDLALARGDLAHAAAVLDAWTPHQVDRRSTLGYLVRRAVLLARQGRRRDAMSALGEALQRAEPGGVCAPFLEVPGVVSLLKSDAHLSSQDVAKSIIRGAQAADGRVGSNERLIEPLTTREREVLALLPTRLTNEEMASSLYVSVNTLKTHVRHIYVKLEVVDRNHAVERAAELGIL